MVFAAQDLFYDLPLSAVTVILSTISIGLFGYGICGVMRPIAVWHVDAVYWSTLPTVKTLQGLHWQDLKDSKPLRYFWYSFGGMFAYEWFPAYIFPWLNSVSIPVCGSHSILPFKNPFFVLLDIALEKRRPGLIFSGSVL